MNQKIVAIAEACYTAMGEKNIASVEHSLRLCKGVCVSRQKEVALI